MASKREAGNSEGGKEVDIKVEVCDFRERVFFPDIFRSLSNNNLEAK